MQSQTAGYIITTLITPPLSSLLTTLPNVKDELGFEAGDTTKDGTLKRYINQESANIAGHCNRVFGFATWQDEFRPQKGIWGEGVKGANNPLTLTKWPLTAQVIAFTGNTYSTTAMDTLSTTVGLFPGQLVFGPGITNGTTIKSINATGNSLMLSQATTATASAVACNTSLQVLESLVVGTSKTLVYGTDFEIQQSASLPGDESVGMLYRLNELGHPRTWPAAQIVVMYQAGYALPGSPVQGWVPLMPSDLEGVVIDNVVQRWQNKGRDLTVRATERPTTGRTEWWVGASPGQQGPYPNDIMSIVNRYRVPVTAAA
jgi:hypothetical protein